MLRTHIAINVIWKKNRHALPFRKHLFYSQRHKFIVATCFCFHVTVLSNTYSRVIYGMYVCITSLRIVLRRYDSLRCITISGTGVLDAVAAEIRPTRLQTDISVTIIFRVARCSSCPSLRFREFGIKIEKRRNAQCNNVQLRCTRRTVLIVLIYIYAHAS